MYCSILSAYELPPVVGLLRMVASLMRNHLAKT